MPGLSIVRANTTPKSLTQDRLCTDESTNQYYGDYRGSMVSRLEQRSVSQDSWFYSRLPLAWSVKFSKSPRPGSYPWEKSDPLICINWGGLILGSQVCKFWPRWLICGDIAADPDLLIPHQHGSNHDTVQTPTTTAAKKICLYFLHPAQVNRKCVFKFTIN